VTFIIAEVGSNWTSLQDCMTSISMAKKCGADAVKFQAFNRKALYGFDDRPHVGESLAVTIDKQVGVDYPDEPWILPLAWLPQLKEKADACGIEFMCTAFSPELVKAVDPYVKRHKVASSDLSYVELLKAVKKTGKPVLLSVGASGMADIKAALGILHGSDVTILYCVANYPCRDVNLFTIDELGEAFPEYDVGFSDHTTDIIYAPLAAVRHHGATVIEKHFTVLPDTDTPDRPHSLTVDEFKTMVDYIRGNKSAQIGPTPSEKDMVLRHNRRLLATQNVAVGEPLKYGVNYGAYRSLVEDASGLSPFAASRVEGCLSKKEIRVGEPITFEVL
jgi:sialic acid synthase SpsE